MALFAAPLVDSDILIAVATGLGSLRADAAGVVRYVKGEECLESLKYLQRLLRRDDPGTRDIFRQLGRWGVVRRDIVPILVHYRDDDDLVLNAIKVLVFMTMPAELTEAGGGGGDIAGQLEALQQSKAAVLDDDVIAVAVSILESPLEHIEAQSAGEEDWTRVQLLLTLFRNLLAIPDPPPQSSAASGNSHLAYLKDELVERLFEESVMDLLLALTPHVGARGGGGLRRDSLLLLEIYTHIFDCHSASSIFSANDKGDGEAHAPAMQGLQQQEAAGKLRRQAQMPFGGRHSRFRGTYVVCNQDSSRVVVAGLPLGDPAGRPTSRRLHIRRGRIKRVACEAGVPRVPRSPTCCLSLRGFAEQFLATSYNRGSCEWRASVAAVLVQTVKEDRERAETKDFANLFKLSCFFLAYQRQRMQLLKKQEVALSGEWPPRIDAPSLRKGTLQVSATLDAEMFSIVLSKWQDVSESVRETQAWDLLAIVSALLKEMIHMLDLVLKTAGKDLDGADSEVRGIAALQHRVLLEQTEYGVLPTLLRLIKSFNSEKQPRRHLANLVEATHVSLRMLEELSKAKDGLHVTRKVRHRRSEEAAEDEDTLSATKQSSDGVADLAGAEDEDENARDDAAEEVPVDFRRCMMPFADNTLVQWYCWLLESFASNSVQLNHYLLRMLRRICNDCGLEPMLYQLSLLSAFERILSDPVAPGNKDHRPIISFLSNLVHRLLDHCQKQPLLFVEILFWKTRKDCHLITINHMLDDLGGRRRRPSRKGGQKGTLRDALNEDEVHDQPMHDSKGTGKQARPKGGQYRKLSHALDEDGSETSVLDKLEATRTQACREGGQNRALGDASDEDGDSSDMLSDFVGPR
eukprot:SM000136S00199  [mRNA]  locus=s136:393383:398241:- [translate_table: standard]